MRGWRRTGQWWVHVRTGQRLPVIAGGTAASFTQTHARFRNDDGGEATATWVAAEDANIKWPMQTRLRIRIQVDETAGGTSANFVGVLRVSVNGGAYNAIASTGPVWATLSPNVSDEGATTNQLTAPTGTFLTGAIDEVDGSAGTTQVDFAAGQFTEFEYVVYLSENFSTPARVGDTLDFRVYRATNALNTYTVTPRVTVVKNVGLPNNYQALSCVSANVISIGEKIR